MTGLATSSCSGNCPAGYICPIGTGDSTTFNDCGTNVYCLAGTSSTSGRKTPQSGYYASPEVRKILNCCCYCCCCCCLLLFVAVCCCLLLFVAVCCCLFVCCCCCSLCSPIIICYVYFLNRSHHDFQSKLI